MKCQVILRTGKGGRQIECGRAGRKNRLSYPAGTPEFRIEAVTTGRLPADPKTVGGVLDKPIMACRFCRQAKRATLSSTAA